MYQWSVIPRALQYPDTHPRPIGRPVAFEMDDDDAQGSI
jgi:hypothetical protein